MIVQVSIQNVLLIKLLQLHITKENIVVIDLVFFIILNKK